LTWPKVMGASQDTGVTWFITMSVAKSMVEPSQAIRSAFPGLMTTVWVVEWQKAEARQMSLLMGTRWL
jgi:hypothetical protein